MVVRIRLAGSNAKKSTTAFDRRLLVACAALVQPAAVMAGVLAFWRFGADLGWTREFAISHGLLSHWQIWVGIFTVFQGSVFLLNRLAHRPRKPRAQRQTTAAAAAEPTPGPLAKSSEI